MATALELELVSPGVPQGTKLGSWLFVIMVNDLDIPDSGDMWMIRWHRK